MRFKTLFIVIVAGLLAIAGDSLSQTSKQISPTHFLNGQLLIADDGMADPRFAKTVILMIDHNKQGAMGVVINKVVGSGPLAKLMEGFGMNPDGVKGAINLHYGGPVDSGVGFLVHGPDYHGPGTRIINNVASVTTNQKVFRAIADGKGPKQKIFVLGYAGWGPGQLEHELARDDWVVTPAKPSFIFGKDVEKIWDRARGKAGLPL